ncbi:MAG TPA: septation protein A [Sphingomonas sp.]
MKPAASPGLRMLIDFGPLVVFFAVNSLVPGAPLERIFAATAAFMIAMAAAMALSWWKTRHVSPMLWISGALVLVFGGLTLYFHDSTFIKMKPTIVYSIFAIILGYGLATHKPLLQMLLETAYPGLSAKGWRLLTINWAVFFVAMAILNEVVWRITAPGATDDMTTWLTFKFPGVPIITVVFAMINIPMLMRHGLQLEKPEEAPIPPEG